MAILPPPYLEEKLPSQFKAKGLEIPFTLNRAVGINDFSKMVLKIKTISTNTTIGILTTIEKPEYINNQYIAKFDINGKSSDEVDAETVVENLQIGQYYKAQLAFVETDINQKENVGVYSTVGVFKYTENPQVKILDPQKKELDRYGTLISNIFFGTVKQNQDVTEKISKYKFDVFDENGNLFDTTDFKIHDIDKDNTIINGEKYSVDIYELKKDLDIYLNYYIIYTIETVNKLIYSSEKYWIKQPTSVTINFPAFLGVLPHPEDGYFSLLMKANQTTTISGSYKIYRTDEKSNFQQWTLINDITFNEKHFAKKEIFEFGKDFSIEQGISYKYAIQQYSFSSKIFTNKILFNYLFTENYEILKQKIFKINFEDMFLSDGKKQLKVKFNPEVSSFKNNILENKINTIGNKYPTFFRNSYIKYKEFPVSGLISCLMDDNHLFIEHKDIDTQLTYENLYEERIFKLNVMDWLCNGEPKIFRSPTEGNYIVRLMNVNLKPNKVLGRMLHTFSATAYEIADYTSENSIQLFNKVNNSTQVEENLAHKILKISNNKLDIPKTTNAEILNGTPGEELTLFFKDNSFLTVVIGYTGYYTIKANDDNPLIGIKSNYKDTISEINFFYTPNFQNNLLNENGEKIKNITVLNNIEQYISFEKNGERDIIKEITSINSSTKIDKRIESIGLLRVQKKLIKFAWLKDGKFYEDKTFKKLINNPSQLVIYQDYLDKESYYLYQANCKEYKKIANIDYTYTLVHGDYDEYREDLFVLSKNSLELRLDQNEKIKNLFIGNGLYIDIVYRLSQYEI